MSPKTLAEKIANELFLDGGTNKPATRVALVIGKEGDSAKMSGWCKQAVIDVICDHLLAAKKGGKG